MDVDRCKLYQVYNKIDDICDKLNKTLNTSSNNVDYTDNGDTLYYIANMREAKSKYDNDKTLDIKRKGNSLVILNTII